MQSNGYAMQPNDRAQKHHEELVPNHKSKLKTTDSSARRISLRHGVVAPPGLGQDLAGRDGEICLVGAGGPVALWAVG